MRSLRFPATIASIVTTAIIAAAAGVASVAWKPGTGPSAFEQPLDAAVLHAEESIDVTPPRGLEMRLQPERLSQSTEDVVVLEARLENKGTLPVAVSPDGVFDLFVQRNSGTSRTCADGMTFLALCEVGVAAPTILWPGEAISRRLRLSPAAPFDEPGRYTVGGKWHGRGSDATLAPFDIVIEQSCQRGHQPVPPPTRYRASRLPASPCEAASEPVSEVQGAGRHSFGARLAI